MNYYMRMPRFASSGCSKRNLLSPIHKKTRATQTGISRASLTLLLLTYEACDSTNGFEDPCGRVEYGSGPKEPLTQRSINRLGVRRIVFQ